MRMLDFIRSILRRSGDCVLVDGLPVPTEGIRLSGKAIPDSHAYLETARAEARRLVTDCGCQPGSTILDIGCGHGRLAVGLLSTITDINYLGVDVNPDSIAWCNRHFRPWPSYQFSHLQVRNPRYYPGGKTLGESFQFPVPAASCDIIHLFSVFSHMEEEDMRIYLRDFPRLLRPHGRVLLTTFVEDNVPPVSVNPDGYIFEKCRGPLHVVRYERSHLFRLVQDSGFQVQHFGHRTELDQQSVLILTVP